MDHACILVGLCMDCGWSMDGSASIVYACQWILHRLLIDSGRDMCVDLYGLCTNCAWIINGLCNDDTWTIYGICINHAWMIRVLCMDCAWSMQR